MSWINNMEESSLHLVLTSLWDKEKNLDVLLLGEWCLPCEEKKQIDPSKYKFRIYSNKEVDLKQKYKDLNYCYSVVDGMMPILTNRLNSLIDKDYSQKEWFILLAPFLQNYVVLCFNRYRDLVNVLKEEAIGSIETYKCDFSELAGADTLAYYRSIKNPYWNQIVYQFLLENIGFMKDNEGPRIGVHHTVTKTNYSWKGVVKNYLFRLLSLLSRFNNIMIKSSYLPFIDEVKASLRLGLVPAIHSSPEVGDFALDLELRSTLADELRRETSLDDFSRAFLFSLPWVLPKCFLEGASTMEERTRNLAWPKKPKVIFTSNSYGYDEYFKFYVISHLRKGAKYVVGQHGANYGTYKSALEWYEFKTADYFLSWGNGLTNNYCKIVPSFNFKINHELGSYDKTGGMLLVQRGPGHRTGPQDRFLEHLHYQEFIRSFFTKLEDFIKQKSIIRLHHGSTDFGTCDQKSWERLCFKNSEINIGSSNIWDLICRSRIVVFGYDSSGFWECLSLNIPSICIWNGGFEHVEENYLWLYEEMAKVGLYHTDLDVGARFLNERWDAIDIWWRSEEVQKVRNKFCEKFSRLSDNPSKELSEVLKFIESEQE